MQITSSGIINGSIQDKFGKFGDEKIDGVPTRSLPITWENVPVGTKTLALIMQDYDAIPVCGFSWIHWLVADIDPHRNELAENASREDSTLIQGKNSQASKQICGNQPESITNFYSGPRPPDQAHEYEIILFALDTKLNLKNSFLMNELLKAMRGHILAQATLIGTYRSQ